MYNKLIDLGLNITDKEFDILEKYKSLFLEYNSKVNLISKNDEALIFEKHIYDSLAFNLFAKKYIQETNINIIDIGTGGGFPALPLSIIYKNANITAIDSTNKKINAIKYMAEQLNLKNIEPICIRAENYTIKNKYDIAVSRAMAELRVILEYTIPFLKIGGYFVAYKSIKAEEEIKNAKSALKTLNSEIIDKIEYTLPIDTENRRVLLIIKKNNIIPDKYPRDNNSIKKNPL